MWWWILGGAIAALVLGAVAWLFQQLRTFVKRGVGAAELGGRAPAELRLQIERILEENRRADAAAHVAVADGVCAFPSPTWRRKPGERVARSLTLLPTRFHDLYYGPEATARLDEPDVRALLIDAALALGRRPELRERDLYAIVDLYEGDLDDAPELTGDLPYHEGDRALSLLVTDVARCLGAGATLTELRARWVEVDADACASLDDKLVDLGLAEADAFATAVQRSGD